MKKIIPCILLIFLCLSADSRGLWGIKNLNAMKQINEKMVYETPTVEVLEVEVEQGFAQSGDGFDDMGYGNHNW